MTDLILIVVIAIVYLFAWGPICRNVLKLRERR